MYWLVILISGRTPKATAGRFRCFVAFVPVQRRLQQLDNKLHAEAAEDRLLRQQPRRAIADEQKHGEHLRALLSLRSLLDRWLL